MSTHGEPRRVANGAIRAATRSLTTSGKLPWAGSLLIIAAFLAGTAALATASAEGDRAQNDPTLACEPPALSASVAGQDRSDESAATGSTDPSAWSEGRWRTMARGPFGPAYPPAVWTGSRLLVVDRDTGRTATYRPDRDRWREVATAPRRVEPDAPFVWTGTELVIIDMTRDAAAIGGLAYDPETDRWGGVAATPL
jgi:hypothetical protein